MTLGSLDPFSDEAHAPFFWRGDGRGLLLVHGFPGTPAEMRPLGRLFHDAGWTVQGLLLPGFGPQIADLHLRSAADWVGAVTTALRSLRETHEQVALLGYSMGGAVAINAAVADPPDALVLVAPFWTMATGWRDALWPLLRLVVRSIRPFKQIDFDDAGARANVHNFFPGADLDDPEVRRGLCELSVPSTVLDQVRRVGKEAFRSAPEVKARTLVVQGRHDPVVRPIFTQQLLGQLPTSSRYLELDADHDLIRRGNGAFSDLGDSLLSFASAAPDAGNRPPFSTPHRTTDF